MADFPAGEAERAAWLADQTARQLAAGAAFPHPAGGAWWLDAAGQPDESRPVFTWITARMAHVYSLGALAGIPGCGPLADAAVAGLLGRLRDGGHGGWVTSIDADGRVDGRKTAYTHAFVLLAASTAVLAGRPRADRLLTQARDVFDGQFLDRAAGLYVDSFDPSFTELSTYRGVNANMHAVEANLALADATGEPGPRERALHIATRVVRDRAAGQDWRVPEHFTPDWVPLPEYHAEQPDHPFEPYGATVGHALEWSRLVLHLRAALGADAPDWLLPAARSLFDRAVADGWAVDGADGFVYTTDWSGRPVVRDRMHWVLAEAIMAAAALHAATGEPGYADWYDRWWRHAVEYVVDPVRGTWIHQLGPDLRLRESVWPGRPDLYHSVQACLLPRLPLAPTAALALRRGAGLTSPP